MSKKGTIVIVVLTGMLIATFKRLCEFKEVLVKRQEIIEDYEKMTEEAVEALNEAAELRKTDNELIKAQQEIICKLDPKFAERLKSLKN